MSKKVVNVSFCAEHAKGGDGINYLPGEEHWRWLEQCVLLLEELCDWPIFVSMTGFRGFETTDAAPHNNERDVMWRIFGRPRVRFLTMAANPGHQVGAAWTIWLGAQAAAKLGYDFMVHTAEDIVPAKGGLQALIDVMTPRVFYVGERWGDDGTELSTQFFACRPGAIAGLFDPCQVRAHGHTERYMRQILDRLDHGFLYSQPFHRSTHDFGEWLRWRKEVLRA